MVGCVTQCSVRLDGCVLYYDTGWICDTVKSVLAV